MFEFGPFRLDPQRRKLHHRGKVLRIRPKLFDTLVRLVENRDRIVEKQELLEAVWPDVHVGESTLFQTVSALRKALSRAAGNGDEYIATIPGQGYQFIGDVTSISEPAAPASNFALTPPPPPAAPQARRASLVALLGAAALAPAVGLWLWSESRGSALEPSALFGVTLTAYEGDERDASLSPDGSHIAYSRRASRSDDWDIYVEVVGGPRAQNPIIESPLDDYFPALSPGGSSIAFWRTESQKSAAIMLASALGGAERRLHVAQHPWSDSLDRGRLAWSPDGRSVAASLRPEESGPTRLARLSAETGEVTWLTSPPDDIRGDVMPAFAPDGRSLAFVRRESSNGGHNIFLLPLSVDGSPAGEPIPLTRFKARASAPAWTPDGGELLFLGQQGRGREGLWSVPPSGGEPRLLWRQSGVDLFPSLAVGQDAEGRIRIVFDEVPPEETDIFEVTIDGPERGKVVKLISSSRRDSLAQYSPDGSRIAYYSGWPERDIWVADADGSNPRRLTFHRDRQALPIRWSPSGDRIAYSSGFDPSADVYVVDATGGAPMRITDDTLDEVHPTWSRDGDWIYYSRIHASTSWELWKTPAHGGEPVQLTRGDRHMMADEAADGETLYFLTRYWQGVLWKMPLSDRLGQPEKLLIFSGRGTNGAELSRSGVFFSTNETMETGPLRFLDLATGESRELLEIPGRLSSVHPDESKALTIYGPRAGNDLKMLTVR